MFIERSIEIAKKYREKVNPVEVHLFDKDREKIRKRVKNIVENELKLRISKGYKGIKLELIDAIIDKKLGEFKI